MKNLELLKTESASPGIMDMQIAVINQVSTADELQLNAVVWDSNIGTYAVGAGPVQEIGYCILSCKPYQTATNSRIPGIFYFKINMKAVKGGGIPKGAPYIFITISSSPGKESVAVWFTITDNKLVLIPPPQDFPYKVTFIWDDDGECDLILDNK